MAEPGGIPRPVPEYQNVKPYDISEITILGGKGVVDAQSTETEM